MRRNGQCALLGLAVLLVGCDALEDVPLEATPDAATPSLPAGTFCTSIAGGPETCFPENDVVATRTTSDGDIWFGVEGAIPSPGVEHVRLFGQTPMGTPTPLAATHLVITAAVKGTCHRGARLTPFAGACDEEAVETVCEGTVRYDATRSELTVTALGASDIEGKFQGTLAVELPDTCCRHLSGCENLGWSPAFVPGDAHITGRFHVQTSQP